MTIVYVNGFISDGYERMVSEKTYLNYLATYVTPHVGKDSFKGDNVFEKWLTECSQGYNVLETMDRNGYVINNSDFFNGFRIIHEEDYHKGKRSLYIYF